MKTISKAFLVGYHGKLNLGDDAICLSLIKTFKKIFGNNAELFVCTYSEKYLQCNLSNEENLNIHFVKSFQNIIKAFVVSSIIMIDGGDHLHDQWHFSKKLQINLSFLMFALLTRIALKKFLILNNGFRVNTGMSSAFLKIILNLSFSVSVRDHDSLSAVSKYKLKEPIMGFDTSVVSLNEDFESNINIEAESVGFSINPIFSYFFGQKDRDRLLSKIVAKEISSFLQNHKKIKFYFLALDSDPKAGDLIFTKEIMNLVTEEIKDPERIKLIAYEGEMSPFLSSFSKLNFVVCCKYHSIVFSYLMKKPMIVISYHPKDEAFASEIGLSNEALISIENIREGNLSMLMDCLLANPKDYKASLPTDEAKKRAIKGIEKCIYAAI